MCRSCSPCRISAQECASRLHLDWRFRAARLSIRSELNAARYPGGQTGGSQDTSSTVPRTRSECHSVLVSPVGTSNGQSGPNLLTLGHRWVVTRSRRTTLISQAAVHRTLTLLLRQSLRINQEPPSLLQGTRITVDQPARRSSARTTVRHSVRAGRPESMSACACSQNAYGSRDISCKAREMASKSKPSISS